MTVTTTPLFAFEDAKIGLNEKQQKVLEAIISLGKCYDRQIADYLKWPINCVCNRRGELLKMGKIECLGLTKNEAGRAVQQYKFKG